MSIPFSSRRSPVICTNGCVASVNPLASQIGNDILKAGGNAADAAVAMAAALNVTSPCSTGIGGDAFCLFYDAKSKTVKGLNGSGRAPSNLSLDKLGQQGFDKTNHFPINHGHAVTVPGAAAAWVDTVKEFGSQKLTLAEILRPAIELAETGFPVHELTAILWETGSYLLKDEKNTFGKDMLLNGRAPKHGEVVRLPHLARTFKELGTHGKEMFYGGRIGRAISDVVVRHGGVLTVEDLQSHVTTFDQPISTDYKQVRLWEIPPNGQGLTALMIMNILEQFQNDEVNLQAMGLNSVPYLHTLIEAIKLSFADTTWYCADPSMVPVPVKQLLSKDYAATRKNLIRQDRVLRNVSKSDMLTGNDTVYFCTADRHGNACSYINSNFMGFGTGIIPEGCGFTLQNRGCGFSLNPDHPNVLAPNKRPFHTIIPAMVTDTDDDDLVMSYGVMGGYMQPQGHAQVLLNMVEFGLDPQRALDQSRICVGGSYGFDESFVLAEDGIPADVVQGLRDLGHTVEGPVTGADRIKFGKGQVISKGPVFLQNSRSKSERNVYWAGSDPRGDGMAIGY